MTLRQATRALLLATALTHASYAAVRPMASYRAIELHVGNAGIGALSASFSVLPLLLAFTVGRQADQYGPARLVVAGSVLSTVAGVLTALANHLAVLLVASALLGLGQLTSLAGQQSAVAAGRAEDRDRGFGILTAMAAVGQIVGPVLGALCASHFAVTGDVFSATAGLAAATVLSALSLPLCWWLFPDTTARAEQRPRERVARELLRIPGMTPTLVAGGLVLAALDLVLAFLPAWAQNRGVSLTTVGLLLALRAAATLLVRLIVDRVVHQVGRRIAMIVSILVAAAGLLLLPAVHVAGAIAVMLALGVGLGVAQPLTMSWVANAVRPGRHGAAMGLRLTGNRFAQTVLPLGIGVISTGAAGVFVTLGTVLAASSAVLLRLPPDRGG